jgi:DNA processing protein
MKISQDTKYWLQIALANGLGPARLSNLLERFGTVENICQQSVTALCNAGLTTTVAESLRSPAPARLDAALQWLEQTNHHLIHWGHSDYPPLLQESPQSPFVLFVAGNPILLSLPQIAIVGSRNATANGMATAALFAHHLSSSGFIVTSGMARGIDAAAHTACLENDASTIAVCGTGLDRVYPAQHVELAARIVQQGAMVSEFAPGTEAHKDHFPRRNRVISGLALGTLVVEAGSRSGALITARFAAEQGREVFAIPGSIHSAQSKGCHQLIKQGAKLVETAADIVEELAPLAISELLSQQQTGGASQALTAPPLAQPGSESPAYEKLLEAMGWDPVNVDVLVERCGLTAGEVSSMLLIMELGDRVDSLSGGHYQRKVTSQQ